MRRTKPEKREILPDVRYNSTLVTNLISRIMWNGKRSTATRLVYGALDICSEKTGKNGLEVLEIICPLSARVVVNQVSMKMQNERIMKIIRALRDEIAK